MRSLTVSFLLASLATMALAVGAPLSAFAEEPSADMCIDAYEEGQRLRSTGKLTQAREKFGVCAESACPDLTRGDCTQWLGEVDTSVPTITLVVTDGSGADVIDVKVTIDGAPLTTSIDGKALPIDPGAHRLTFERPGSPPKTLDIVAREGEKNRRIEVVLDGSGGNVSAASVAIHPLTWVLGALGVGGLLTSAIVGGVGYSEQRDAEETCAPSCTDDVVDSIRIKYVAADLALGLGLAFLAAGIVTGAVSATSGSRTVVAIVPFDAGALLFVGGAF